MLLITYTHMKHEWREYFIYIYIYIYTYRKHKNVHTKLACPQRQTHACIHKERKGDRQTNSDKLDLGSLMQSSKADDGHTHAIWSQPNSGLQKGSWTEQWSGSLETGEALPPISSQQPTTRITALAGPLQYLTQQGPGRSEPKWAQHGTHTDDDDDVELNVLGCRVDILGTNCEQCVSMVQCCFTSTETIRLVRTGTSTFTQLLNSDTHWKKTDSNIKHHETPRRHPKQCNKNWIAYPSGDN